MSVITKLIDTSVKLTGHLLDQKHVSKQERRAMQLVVGTVLVMLISMFAVVAAIKWFLN